MMKRVLDKERQKKGVRERPHASRLYKTATRQASFNLGSSPCCCRLCFVVKPSSQAGQECALRRRWAHGDGTGEKEDVDEDEDDEPDDEGSGEVERERLEEEDV